MVLGGVLAAIATVAGTVVDSAKTFFTWIIDIVGLGFKTLPRAVLFLIFLSIFVVIGNFLVPIMFNLTGSFCVEGDLYRGSPANVIDNVILTTTQVGDVGNNQTNRSVEGDCITQIRHLGEGSVNIFYDGYYCTGCPRINDSSNPLYVASATGFFSSISYCGADVYPVDYEDKTDGQKRYCENLDEQKGFFKSCEPPPGYYWVFNTTTYTLYDANKVVNSSEDFVAKLKEDGFNPVFKEGDEPDVVGLGCDVDKPTIQVVGVNVFNWSMWLMFLVIGLLWWAYTKL